MEEYFINRHVEEVPLADVEKWPEGVFLLANARRPKGIKHDHQGSGSF